MSWTRSEACVAQRAANLKTGSSPLNDQEQVPGQPYPNWSRTLRLTFSYEGSNVRLVSRQSVEMMPPPSDPLTPQEERSGFWYELQDEQERVLYRRVVHNPIRFEAEVFSHHPEVPLTRIKVDNPQGAFQLLVPETDEAAALVLFSSPLEPEFSGEPARELVRFDLK